MYTQAAPAGELEGLSAAAEDYIASQERLLKSKAAKLKEKEDAAAAFALKKSGSSLQPRGDLSALNSVSEITFAMGGGDDSSTVVFDETDKMSLQVQRECCPHLLLLFLLLLLLVLLLLLLLVLLLLLLLVLLEIFQSRSESNMHLSMIKA